MDDRQRHRRALQRSAEGHRREATRVDGSLSTDFDQRFESVGDNALPHARHLDNMLELARVITLGALNRNESRGAHYKPEFPNRDDANWLKTTIAEYSGEGPVFSYEGVDISLIEPRKRDYSHEKKETAAASGSPQKGGGPQIPSSVMQQKPANLSGPAGDVKVN